MPFEVRFFRVLFFTLGMVFLSSCSTIDTVVSHSLKMFYDRSTKLDATFIATKDLNPDANGRPSPAVVRFYELKSLSVFENADFFALYEQDKALLGDDLAHKEEMKFMPGETKDVFRELQPGTKFIGILVAYRDLKNAHWRAAVETPIQDTTEVNIHLDELSVSIKPKE